MKFGKHLTKYMRHEMTLKLAQLLAYNVTILKSQGFAPRIMLRSDEWYPTESIQQALQLAAGYNLVIYPTLESVDVWPKNEPDQVMRYLRPRDSLRGYAANVELQMSIATTICYALIDLLERTLPKTTTEAA